MPLAALLLAAPLVVAPGTPVPEIARRIAEAPAGPVVVRFAPGRHEFGATLEIARDGVTLVGQDATLTGARALPASKPVLDPAILARLPASAREAAREIPLPGPPAPPTPRGFALSDANAGSELFAGDAPLVLARYPNDGWLATGAVEGRSFAFADPKVGAWKGAWARGYWAFDWADSATPVTIEPGRIVLPDDKPGPVSQFGVKPGRRFYLENALEALDAPGEYVLDPARRVAYLIPPKGSAPLSLSVLGAPLVRVRNARAFAMKGLALSAGRGTAVWLEGCDSARLSGLTVTGFADRGLVVRGGHDVRIADSRLSDLGGSGVLLSGGDRRTLEPARHLVTGCRFERLSRLARTYHPAVEFEGVGSAVERSQIVDLPHQAVMIHGNDHRIEGNTFARVCLETGDSGAIYIRCDPTEQGNVVRANEFRDIRRRLKTEGGFTDVMGVYLDDCASGTTVEGNTFRIEGTGVMIGGGRDNVVRNNRFVGTDPAIHVDARALGWARENFTKSWFYADRLKELPVTSAIWRERYPELAREAETGADLRAPVRNRIERNRVEGGAFLRLQDGLTPEAAGVRDNSVKP